MLLLNAGSIGNKMDRELVNLVYSFSNRPAIIGISETWLSSNINDSELSINGQYTVFRSDRQTRGGGVCLLIMNSLKGVLHLWALFLKTLCIFSKNKATLDKVSYGSGQKCSKELENYSFTSVETIVVKLQ